MNDYMVEKVAGMTIYVSPRVHEKLKELGVVGGSSLTRSKPGWARKELERFKEEQERGLANEAFGRKMLSFGVSDADGKISIGFLSSDLRFFDSRLEALEAIQQWMDDTWGEE